MEADLAQLAFDRFEVADMLHHYASDPIMMRQARVLQPLPRFIRLLK